MARAHDEADSTSGSARRITKLRLGAAAGARFVIVLSSLLGGGLAACGEVPAARPMSEPDASASPREAPSERIAGAEAKAAGDAAATPDGAPRRWVAIGDLHGDFAATRAAFRLAGAIDDADRWIGGDLVVVQCGDQLDRGDDEPEILAFLDRIAKEARTAGGAVHVLVGNHELMNAMGDLRYVTPEGFVDYAAVANQEPHAAKAAALAADIPAEYRGRIVAFAPGGPEAQRLAEHPMVLQLGDTVFVHGGVESKWARIGLSTLNAQTAAFLKGEGPIPEAVTAQDGPLWSRRFASDDSAACEELTASLEALGAKRMIVGHTVQGGGITSGCDERVWRVDVGLSSHYGGPIQVLAMKDGALSVLDGSR